MTTYHLAQINIAKAKDEMDSELMTGFVSRLGEINKLAEESPGFVWRLQGDGGDATSFRVFDHPLLLVNMSVWEDVESLKNYVYRSLHVELLTDRDAWFHKVPGMHQALWWVPKGHIPTIDEGRNKLEHLQNHGPSQIAFTFARPHPAPISLDEVQVTDQA